MRYLLDTNTCVHHLRHGSGSPIAVKLTSVGRGDVVTCSVVLAELAFGALRSRDVAKNVAEVQTFLAGFSSLAFDDASAQSYAQIKADLAAKGTPIGPYDLMIAAIALVPGLTLVTHNTAEFSRVVGLSIEDWQV